MRSHFQDKLTLVEWKRRFPCQSVTSVEVEGWALLVTVNVAPCRDPTAVGPNLILKGTLLPGGVVPKGR